MSATVEVRFIEGWIHSHHGVVELHRSGTRLHPEWNGTGIFKLYHYPGAADYFVAGL